MNVRTANSYLYILILVGMISAFGPFVTDFYLPALPELSEYFGTSTFMIQLTLTVSMIGLATGQLLIGPISDRYGRKPPLILSLVLFIVSTIACLISTNIGSFLLFRFIQGIAGAGGVVISKSIATDLYEGKQLARFFSMLSSVQGLAPIFAPVLGGVLLLVTDWRGIFLTLLIIGLILLLTTIHFHESLQTPVQNSSSSTAKAYIPILRNRHFMRYVLAQTLVMGVMFTYIAASPFIFQKHYGLSSLTYSICFGINALGIMAGSLLTTYFPKVEKALSTGVSGFLLMSILVAATLLSGSSVYAVETALFLLLVCMGMILPTTTALALEPVRENSGYASAVLGFMAFLAGGICSPLAGLGNMLITTSVIILICAVSTLLLTIRKRTA